MYPLQVGVARFKAIDVRVASSFRSKLRRGLLLKVCFRERAEVLLFATIYKNAHKLAYLVDSIKQQRGDFARV